MRRGEPGTGILCFDGSDGFAKRLAEFGPFESKTDRRLDETKFIPGIITSPLEKIAIDGLCFEEKPYGVRDLYLAPVVRWSLLYGAEDIGSEHISAYYTQVGKGFPRPWFFNHVFHLEHTL